MNRPNLISVVFAKAAHMVFAAFLRDKICPEKANRRVARFGERGDLHYQPSGGKL